MRGSADALPETCLSRAREAPSVFATPEKHFSQASTPAVSCIGLTIARTKSQSSAV